MAVFLVRVALRRANVDDHDELRIELEKRGFKSEITDGRGRTYRLPWDEYSYEADASAEKVTSSAQAAADALGFRVGIVAVECSAIAVSGLSPR